MEKEKAATAPARKHLMMPANTPQLPGQASHPTFFLLCTVRKSEAERESRREGERQGKTRTQTQTRRHTHTHTQTHAQTHKPAHTPYCLAALLCSHMPSGKDKDDDSGGKQSPPSTKQATDNTKKPPAEGDKSSTSTVKHSGGGSGGNGSGSGGGSGESCPNCGDTLENSSMGRRQMARCPTCHYFYFRSTSTKDTSQASQSIVPWFCFASCCFT